ncbi:universal stress protein [Rubrobacter marinus]|uniref:universal stress protein n=1 Tax=Rubrobacter marinus TaxID=2653852 RepID=UPI00140A5B97|nr:universal stress protein [Rubrobacter marinus]
MVVGGRGHGAIGRILLGSVSEGVVHHSKFPVLVVRGGQDAWPPERVIVGDDGSGAAGGAAGLAASIGAVFGAGIVLVRAYRYPPEPIGGWSPEDRRRLDEERAREEDALAKRARNLRQRPGNGLTTRLVEGDPAAAILRAGEESRSLLAVGSRGLGVIGRARFGSVSSKVLRAATGPILVYPHVSGGSARANAGEASTAGRRTRVPS